MCSAPAPRVAPGHGACQGRVLAAAVPCSRLLLGRKLQDSSRKGDSQQCLVVGQPCSCPELLPWLLLACDLYFEKCQGCDGVAVWLLLRRSLDPVPPWQCDDRGFPALPSVTSIQTALSLGGVCFSELGVCRRDLLTSVCLLPSYTVHLLFASMAKIKAAFPGRRNA